jgi:hypothetical protein
METIDMNKYANSEDIVPECEGCARVFGWTPEEGMVTSQKCRAYIKPAGKWPKEGEQFAMHSAMVRRHDSKGRPISPKMENVPVIQKYCPSATHFMPLEIINTDDKTRSGQQKQR